MSAASTLGRFLYGLSIATNAALLGLVVVVALGPVVPNGEDWLGLAYTWYFSLPVVALLSLCTVWGFTRYRSREAVSKILFFYASQVVSVAVLAASITYGLGALGMHRWLVRAMS